MKKRTAESIRRALLVCLYACVCVCVNGGGSIRIYLEGLAQQMCCVNKGKVQLT